MSTEDRRDALTMGAAREQVRRTCFEGGTGESVGRVGIESEFFVLRRDGGRPTERVSLRGPDGIWALLDRVAEREIWLERREEHDGVPIYPVKRGGDLAFEPGGQIEFSTAPREALGVLLPEWEEVVVQLRRELAESGAVMACLGLDPWHDLSETPLQLDAPRYRCMDEHYAYRGPAGAVMMRNTASCQVNLDLGPEEERDARYLLANLVSPWITASFAASPGPGVVSSRVRAWQLLDPTRTGFPPLIGARDSREAYVEAALAADVMVFREEGPWEGAAPGFPFARWIEEGHPRHGSPTRDDLDYHLTTVFLEVRPRGFLEFRAADALPPPWHGIPAMFLCGLFYGRGSVERTLSLLAPVRHRLPELWRRAAVEGLRGGDLGKLAPRLWTSALDGLESLSGGFVRPEEVTATLAYFERFPDRRRMPADELSEMTDSSEMLRWATGEREQKP